MKIDRFITSTNENPDYIYCWPLVAQVTKKLFNCDISMAFITSRCEDDPLVSFFREFGDVKLFKEIEGIPSANQAKVSRLYLASCYKDKVCVINDVDIMPLQNKFLEDKLFPISDDSLVTIGYNAYFETEDRGKFPMIYVTANGSTFDELINPNKLGYEDLLNSWRGENYFDGKEDISNIPSMFSDESLIRLLIYRWGEKSRVKYLDRNFVGYRAIERVDRFRWNINSEKLEERWYIDAHLPRPLNKNINLVEKLVNFFSVNDYINKIENLRR